MREPCPRTKGWGTHHRLALASRDQAHVSAWRLAGCEDSHPFEHFSSLISSAAKGEGNATTQDHSRS